MTKRRPLPSTTSVPGLPRSSTKCGNTACEPSRRRRIDAGAQKAALRSRSLMRAPTSIALSCASPLEPGATEDHSASRSQRGGTPPGVAVESTARQNQPAIDADIPRDAVRDQNRRRHAAAAIPDNFRRATCPSECPHRGGAMNTAAGRPARCPSPAGSPADSPAGRAPYRASSFAACSSDFIDRVGRQQMTDVGPVDHHAAEQRELRNRRPNQLEARRRATARRTAAAPAHAPPRRRPRAPSDSPDGADRRAASPRNGFPGPRPLRDRPSGRPRATWRPPGCRRSAADIARHCRRCRTPRSRMHDAYSVSRSIPPTAPRCRRQNPIFSTSSVLAPRMAANSAADMPAAPAPITTTS